MGLANSSISVDGFPTWLESLPISDRSFTMCLNKSTEDSYMTIGLPDDKTSDDFNYHKLTHEDYWRIPLDEIKVDGTSLEDSFDGGAIVDSGTSLLAVPTDLFNSFVAKTGASKNIAGE